VGKRFITLVQIIRLMPSCDVCLYRMGEQHKTRSDERPVPVDVESIRSMSDGESQPVTADDSTVLSKSAMSLATMSRTNCRNV
jgi:hypothetical protein